MRDHFLFRSDIPFSVHLFQLIRGLEESVRVEVVCPFQVHRARNGAAARRTHDLPRIFAVAAGVDDHDGRIAQIGANLLNRCEPVQL